MKVLSNPYNLPTVSGCTFHVMLETHSPPGCPPSHQMLSNLPSTYRGHKGEVERDELF